MLITSRTNGHRLAKWSLVISLATVVLRSMARAHHLPGNHIGCLCQGLTAAARRGDLPEVARLLDLGVDPNVVCSLDVGWKYTALMEAADYGHPDVCRSLLHAHACANRTCSRGLTPLTWACTANRRQEAGFTVGHVHAVTVLLSALGRQQPLPDSYQQQLDVALGEVVSPVSPTLWGLQQASSSMATLIVGQLLDHGASIKADVPLVFWARHAIDVYQRKQHRLLLAEPLGLCRPLALLVQSYLPWVIDNVHQNH